MITKIVSGGQAGVDRAALDAAMLRDIPHGGWCPHGRLAEDGQIPEVYLLRETDSADYSCRTQRNVEDSDGTLIVTGGPLTGGTALTRSLAKCIGSPVLVLDLRKEPGFEEVEEWLLANRIHTLNVAGPRETQQPGIGKQAGEWLNGLLENLHSQGRSLDRKTSAVAFTKD
ncbi:MAG: putative molybdenum carrier protein [Planctomycetaceae bacterium]